MGGCSVIIKGKVFGQMGPHWNSSWLLHHLLAVYFVYLNYITSEASVLK